MRDLLNFRPILRLESFLGILAIATTGTKTFAASCAACFFRASLIATLLPSDTAGTGLTGGNVLQVDQLRREFGEGAFRPKPKRSRRTRRCDECRSVRRLVEHIAKLGWDGQPILRVDGVLEFAEEKHASVLRRSEVERRRPFEAVTRCRPENTPHRPTLQHFPPFFDI